MKNSITLVWFLTIATLGQSQTLLNELAQDKPESNPPAFKAMKIVNLQSTKTAVKEIGICMFLIDLAVFKEDLIHFMA